MAIAAPTIRPRHARASLAAVTRLSELTTLRLGGPARALVEARTEGELLEAVRGEERPLLLLAGGSNLVVADDGFPARSCAC